MLSCLFLMALMDDRRDAVRDSVTTNEQDISQTDRADRVRFQQRRSGKYAAPLRSGTLT
jgi:hypothetical protein